MTKKAIGVVGVLVCSMALAQAPARRELTFDERVRAQTAIERVYYRYQIGATKAFSVAVPTPVIEAKVHKYLEESAALDVYWRTAVTDQSLQQELERMARGTRMPERLHELFSALGDDPFLIKECLARPALVDRLTHNFYAFDAGLHATEREQATALRERLVSGALSPTALDPHRFVEEWAAGAAGPDPALDSKTSQERLTPDEFKKRRSQYPSRVGEISDVQETRDTYVIHVVLSESATTLKVASYVVPKIAWDVWWAGARRKAPGDSVVPVATVGSPLTDIPALHSVRPTHPSAPSATCADDYWDNASLDDVAPAPRSKHLAVWTGTQMIVWGGIYTYSLQTGGRYDPVTDTWSPMSAIGAPTSRIDATAVWTGHEMIVWGGRPWVSTTEQFNTGGRYDPVSDTWRPTTGKRAPGPRYQHTAVWTGSRMIVWGGAIYLPQRPYNFVWATGGQYDPETDTWTPTSIIRAPYARSGHAAAWTGHYMVVLGGNGLDFGGRYDPVTDRWLPVSYENGPRGLYGPSTVWTGSEMIVWGGEHVYVCPNGQDLCFQDVNTGARYDPERDSWTATSTVGAPMERQNHLAVWTGHEMIVWGGSRLFDTTLNTGGRYDPTTDQWTSMTTAGAPFPRSDSTAVWSGSRMIVWGGFGSEFDNIPQHARPTSSGGRYDPATDSWTPTAIAPWPGGRSQTAVWTGSQALLWSSFANGARYDAVTDTWASISSAGPSIYQGHTAVWTGSRMVVWGGDTFDGSVSTGGRYDPLSDLWSPTSDSGAPTPRAQHTAVWTGSSMVVWGGRSYDSIAGNQTLDTGGRYDPEADVWSPTSESNAPSARAQHTAVWSGSTMVVWGGGVVDAMSPALTTVVNTGGRYDPASDSWTPTSTTNAPTARAAHTAVWTGNSMIVWGAGSDSSGRGTGGRYDPATDQWTPTSMIQAPPERIAHAAVWTGRLMVIWSGYYTYYSYFSLGDGARYDPVSDRWSAMTNVGQPEPRGYSPAVWTGTSMLVVGGAADYDPWAGGGSYVPGTTVDDDCDGDGITTADGDCDDHNPAIYPGAPQLCDGINNDCNSPNWPNLPYDTNEIDADGDGYFICGGDCDDNNSAVYPGAPQVCDGVNDDCNDPAWPAVSPDEADADGDGVRVCGGDCDDHDWSVGPDFIEYCDGRDNDCNGIVDDKEANADCDDYNPCTDDVCHGVDGCAHPANHLPCDDHNACTVNDVCGGGFCNGTPAIGVPCDDRDPCTSNDACDASGRCAGTAPSCDDGDPCTIDYADSGQSCACAHNPNVYGACDDGDACTAYSYCNEQLACVSQSQVQCDDHNPCTDDSCVSPGGCVFTPNDGPACDDGNPCTDADTCHAGVCVGSLPTDCASPCPAGSTPTEGGCAVTYDIDASALDNLEYTCETFPEGLDGYYDLGFRPYGFHWMDTGRAIGPVLRVAMEIVSGVHCDRGTSHLYLNGSMVAEFVRDIDCNCPPMHHAIVVLTASSVDSYVGSGLNQIRILARPNGEGLSADDALGGAYARVTVTYRRGAGPCVAAACDVAAGGCTFTDLPDGSSCDDGNPCTVDSCQAGSCAGTPLNCDDGNVCTTDSCDPAAGCVHTNNANACSDGNACTINDTCAGGTCHGGPALACDDGNLCTDDRCDPAAGCVHTNNARACDDGNACTVGDTCGGGSCHSGAPVTCQALDTCHTAGACNPATGVCTTPAKPDGTACDDGNLCTTGDACRSGVCTSSSSGLNHPDPRTSGYYHQLCEKAEHQQTPYHGDALTDADALCVAGITPAFSDLRTAADICAVIDDDGQHGGRHHGGDGGPGTKECDKAEDELIATALNICRARLCEGQQVDSRCGDGDDHDPIETTVAVSFGDANTLLDDAQRTKATCQRASCELKEINNAHALEMNSVVLARETQGVRLSWQAMELEDGTGQPDAYEVWRRPLRSASAFVKIGRTTDSLTFLDTSGRVGAWEYEVTADIP